MTLAVVASRALVGVEAPLVTVEAHLANGLPSFTLVGLPEAEVKEARDRVRAALLTARFDFPARRITVNLAPADLPKEGGRFDLAIALAILAASGQIPREALAEYEFVGELALTGELRPVRGALAMTARAWKDGRTFVVPRENAAEAALCAHARVLAAGSLLEVCAHLTGASTLPAAHAEPLSRAQSLPDLAEVKGQAQAKRALEVAAAGLHSLLMYGPPGTGKSMLAARLPGILPPMSEDEALEAAAIQSLSPQGFRPERWGVRPFRAPHHTASAVALVGGGAQPRPGEISLAHRGVLFLDELPEFPRSVLEVLREPLESGVIHVSRAARQAEFPARFMLVAAMNPCPCGYLGDASGRCRCTPDQVARYRGRISGPLMDRIDIAVEVPALPETVLSHRGEAEGSSAVRARVAAAHARARARQGKPNRELGAGEIERYCPVDHQGAALLRQAVTRLNLSARAYHRVLKVARSIADLAGTEVIAAEHVAEAIQYRRGMGQ